MLAVVAVVLGASLAGRVARRPTRDELRTEASRRPVKANPASDLVALMRTDRAGIWRSVPMRRGMLVLALLPGLVAVGGSFGWEALGIFPGLVASGGALLFGVNSWCLDARGALWRDSLPVSPRLAFCSRALVLMEILVVATVLTLVVASVRAGRADRLRAGRGAVRDGGRHAAGRRHVAARGRWRTRTPSTCAARAPRRHRRW